MSLVTISIIVLVAVAAILIFFAAWGFHQGFLRHVLTTMAFVITIVAAGLLAPTVSPIIQKSFIGKSIEDAIGTYVADNISSPVIEKSKAVQEAIIEKLPLPPSIQKDIAENNTAGEYVKLGVDGFTDYLKARISGLLINISTYLLLMLVIYLVLRILMHVFHLINHIPLIGGINRLLGAVIGLAEGLLIIWTLCLIVMALAGTPFGVSALKVIRENEILTYIYDHNGIIIGANAIFHSIL